LAFLGFNILTFIGKETGDVGGLINSFINKIKQSGNLMNIIKNTIFVSATGSQAIVDNTAKVSDNLLEKVQNSTKIGTIPPDNPDNPPPNNPPPNNPLSNFKSNVANSTIPNTTVQKTEFTPSNQYNSALNNNTGTMNYEADDSLSSIQCAGSKSGWCYIGEDRGFRSCAQVDEGEKCMSGDIFPTNEVCINPKLRA
jgi:hypothetical protein